MRLSTTIIFVLAAGGSLAFAVPTQPAAAKPSAKTQSIPGTTSAEAVLDLASWLAERSNGLAIKSRTYDPFGKRKDPSSKAPVLGPKVPDEIPGETKEPEVDTKLAFPKAVSSMKVTMVGSGQFSLAGGTTLNQGQIFKLTAEGVTFKVKVVKIATSGIILEDTSNGNRATITGGGGDSLPPGMQRGGQPVAPQSPINTPPVTRLPNAPNN